MTIASATARLVAEMDRLEGASHIILSTNVELRLDGLPRAGGSEPDDPGAALYFKHDQRPRCLACDRWDRVADNITALAKHVEAIRGMDRWGVGTLEQAFGGYLALPPAAEEWWLILDISPDATSAQIDCAYKKLARIKHPDTATGSVNEMTRLNQAKTAAAAAQENG
jgi:hypothetical protein